MAEYVRRKRPPADHPFWFHRNDRAHPPSVVWPVALPAALGLAIGLAAGLKDPLSVGKAFQTAFGIAGTAAGALALGCAIPLVYNALARPRHGEPWGNALAAFLGIGVVAFLATLAPVAALLLWYAACSGLGPWLGTAVGATVGLVPGIGVAWYRRHRWSARRRLWPRWETMRRRHRRRTAAAATPAQPAATAGPVEPPGAVTEEGVTRREQDQPGA